MSAKKDATNEELMLAFQNGDGSAFEMLYERYKNPIYNYTRGLARQDELARELAQETFLKVYKNKDQYDSKFNFTTWLWSIARNTTIDHLKRKDATRFSVDISYKDEDGPKDAIEQLESPLSGPEEETLKKAEREMVQECLADLPDSQREATVLRIFSELSYEEVAETMKTTVSAVKSLLNRAKAGLLMCVEGKLKGSEA